MIALFVRKKWSSVKFIENQLVSIQNVRDIRVQDLILNIRAYFPWEILKNNGWQLT